MVTIEADLDLGGRFRRNEIMAGESTALDAGSRTVAFGIGYHAAALDHIQALRSILDLALELQDLLIKNSAA